MPYSMPSRRACTSIGAESGRSASISRCSEVVFDSQPITMYRSLRVAPTPTQNRSSSSRYTSASRAGSAPTTWRITRLGRWASSVRTANSVQLSFAHTSP